MDGTLEARALARTSGEERIDRLVGRHAEPLSARLQEHRQRLSPPSARKELRRFTSGEVAELLGVKDACRRKLHLEGRAPRSGQAGGASTRPKRAASFATGSRPAPSRAAPTCPAGARAITSRSWPRSTPRAARPRPPPPRIGRGRPRSTATACSPSTSTRRPRCRRCTASGPSSTCSTAAPSTTRSATRTRCRSARSSSAPTSPGSTSCRATSISWSSSTRRRAR